MVGNFVRAVVSLCRVRGFDPKPAKQLMYNSYYKKRECVHLTQASSQLYAIH